MPPARTRGPILIESLDAAGELVVTIAPILNESITVSGSAPSIESTPGAATASLSARDVAVRQPTNLMQAIENVPGVNQVSEGQAAVPAISGLARGRTLILIDGARVSSERRVGASATFLDPSLIEGVDVSRGPGSVAYGSDAFGGVISVRTRRVMPGSPCGASSAARPAPAFPSSAVRSRSPRAAGGRRAGGRRTRAKQTTGTAPRTKYSTRDSATAGSWSASSSKWQRAT